MLTFLNWRVGLVLTLLLFGGTTFFMNKKFKKRENALITMLNYEKDTVEYYQNQYGDEVVKKQLLEAEKELIVKLYEEDKLEYLNQFNDMKSKIKRLQSTTQIQTIIKDSIRTKIEKSTDTLAVFPNRISFSDEYFSMTGEFNDSLFHMNYFMEIPIDIIVYHQRKHLKLLGKNRKILPRWGKKDYFTEVTSKNKKVKITNINSIILKK